MMTLLESQLLWFVLGVLVGIFGVGLTIGGIYVATQPRGNHGDFADPAG